MILKNEAENPHTDSAFRECSVFVTENRSCWFFCWSDKTNIYCRLQVFSQLKISNIGKFGMMSCQTVLLLSSARNCQWINFRILEHVAGFWACMDLCHNTLLFCIQPLTSAGTQLQLTRASQNVNALWSRDSILTAYWWLASCHQLIPAAVHSEPLSFFQSSRSVLTLITD